MYAIQIVCVCVRILEVQYFILLQYFSLYELFSLWFLANGFTWRARKFEKDVIIKIK